MTLLADREYIGRDWFGFLVNELSLNFIIRLPKEDYKKDLGYLYGQFIRHIRKGKVKDLPIKIGDNTFRIVGTKNRNPENTADDLVILLTNLPNKKHKILAIYGLRWQIESMFKSLKTNGFSMENLGFTNPKKVRVLLCIVIACYVLCVCEGIKKIKKSNGQNSRVSIFQKGYQIVCIKSQKIALFVEWIITDIFPKNKKVKPIFK